MKVVAVISIFALCFPAVLASAVWASRATDDTIDNCKKTEPVTLSDQEKQQIVDAHNQLRQTLETDKVKFKKIEWDDMLAGRAQLTANLCELRHSYHQYYCPGVSYLSSRPSAQNYLRYVDRGRKIDFAAEVNGWWQEKTQYNYTTDTCDPGRICGHYLQMAWQKTHKVGCGYKICEKAYGGYDSVSKTFSRVIDNQFFFVCNYYPSFGDPHSYNREGSRPYGPGCNITPGEVECSNDRGTYNFQTCECKCNPGFFGKWCEFKEACEDSYGCASWVAVFCNNKNFFGEIARETCPNICGVC